MWDKGRRPSPSLRAEVSLRLTSNSWDTADADAGRDSRDAANPGQDTGSCRREQHGQPRMRGQGDTASIPGAGREGREQLSDGEMAGICATEGDSPSFAAAFAAAACAPTPAERHGH